MPRTTTVRPDGLSDHHLNRALGRAYRFWQQFVAHVEETYPPVAREWMYSEATGMWTLRLRQRQRTLLYLLPRDRHFLVAFVFGPKAAGTILVRPDLPVAVRAALAEAEKYVEGQGIRLEVRSAADLEVMRKLTAVKLGG